MSITSRPWSPKKLRHRRSHVGRTKSSEGGSVGGTDNDNTPSQPFLSEIVLQKLPDLATTFSDEGDHVDVGSGVAGNHADQRRFADAASTEYSEPLPLPGGNESINRPDAGLDPLRDRTAGQYVGGLLKIG
jgi:hypothetical protein